MYSNTMEILSKKLDPITVLEGVIEKITDAERCYPIDAAVREHFNRNFKSAGRNWGESRGDVEDVKLQKEALDPGFHVEFTYEEYSRGCFMGTSCYKVFVPDNLVKLYEQSMTDDYASADEQLDNEIEKLIKDRIASMKTEILEVEEKKRAETEANNRAYEASERAEWERLSEKYGKVE